MRQRITCKLCTLIMESYGGLHTLTHAVVYGHWTQATVLDGHGGASVTTHRQGSPTFSLKGGIRYTAHTHYLRIEIVFCRSSTGVISCRLTFWSPGSTIFTPKTP